MAADNQTYGDYFLRYNGDVYLAINVIDIYKKGAASNGVPDIGVYKSIGYPNPAGDRLFIQSERSDVLSDIEVYAMDGRVVLSTVYSANGIDVSGLAPGMYLVRSMHDGAKREGVRFIKE